MTEMKTKQIAFRMARAEGAKAFDSPDEGQLAKINQYTLRPHTAEELYVARLYLAHDQADRDSERFPVEVLTAFNESIAGKSFLIGHGRESYGVGLFFDSELVEEEGINWLVASAYMPRETQGKVIADIEAGIATFVSIGFMADTPVEKKGENGAPDVSEWQLPAEALEGSIVWLGAQPGAQLKEVNNDATKPQPKGVTMDAIEQCKATCQKCLDDCKACMADPNCTPEMMKACEACIPACEACIAGGITTEAPTAGALTPDAKAAKAADDITKARTRKMAEALVKTHALANRIPASMVGPFTDLAIADFDNTVKVLEAVQAKVLQPAGLQDGEPKPETDREAFWTKHEKAIAKSFPGLRKETLLTQDEATVTQFMKEVGKHDSPSN